MSFALCLRGRAPSSLLTFPRSNKLYWFPHTLEERWKYALGVVRHLEILMPPGSTLSRVSWNTRAIEVWHVCALCCQMDYPLRRSLFPFFLRALFCAGARPTVGVAMATISVSGEYLVLGWSAIRGLLKALSQKISQLPTERRSSQHSRWISEPERGKKTERKGARERSKKSMR